MIAPLAILRCSAGSRENVIESRQYIVGQSDLESPHRCIELADGARTDDGRCDTWLMQQPRERDIGRLFADLITQGLVLRDLLTVLR